MARFESGQPKPKGSGRKRGTPNHKSKSLEESLLKIGLDVPAELAALLPELAPEDRVQALLQLMSFLYPKRKAIEQHIEIDQPKIEPEVTRAERCQRMAKSYRRHAASIDVPALAEAYGKIAEHFENGAPDDDAYGSGG